MKLDTSKADKTRMGGVDHGQNISSLFSILLFFLFTLCIVFVMVIGANVYKNIAKRMDDNFTKRTGIMYILNKVRQYDYIDYVNIKEIENHTVLELKEIETDLDYHTLIYCYEGSLRELFKAVEDEIPLSEGIEIVKARSAGFTMDEKLLFITLEGEAEVQQTYISLRSGGFYGE